MRESTERPVKTAAASLSEQVHVLTMKTLNGNERLSGAQLMEWVDEVAVVTARRHAGSDVTTVKILDLEFLCLAINKDTVVVKGKLVYTGSSSMLIRVDVYKERFCGEQIPVATAQVLMVALDEEERPITVPLLLPQTPQEQADFDEGAAQCSRPKRITERHISC